MTPAITGMRVDKDGRTVLIVVLKDDNSVTRAMSAFTARVELHVTRTHQARYIHRSHKVLDRNI